MDTRMKNIIVIDGFLLDLGKEYPEEELIIHTHQSSQYTESSFQEVLRKNEAVSSTNCKGNPYDNAFIKL